MDVTGKSVRLHNVLRFNADNDSSAVYYWHKIVSLLMNNVVRDRTRNPFANSLTERCERIFKATQLTEWKDTVFIFSEIPVSRNSIELFAVVMDFAR